MRARARIYRLYRRFAASTRGVAAIEFAMILPVLAVLFLGAFDGGRAIAIYMKVRAATYSLAAITNQYETIQLSDIQSITGATSVILSPYSSGSAVVTISQIAISKNKERHGGLELLAQRHRACAGIFDDPSVESCCQ